MKNAWFSKKHFELTRKFKENAGVAIVLDKAGKPVAATLIQETPPSGGQDDFQLVASAPASGFAYLMLADGHVTAKGKAFAKSHNIDATPQGLLSVVENRDELTQPPEKSSVQHKYAADLANPPPGTKYTRDWGFK